MKKIIALVPMRHDSERVPGKNYRLLAGKPLYHYILTTLLSCPEISQVVVDTDSPKIIAGLEKSFPQVLVLERPENLRSGDIPMNEVLIHTTEQIDADFYLQTHSTNPLLKSSTISAAIDKFLDNYPSFDSLFSVTRLQTRLYDSEGRAVNHNPSVLLRTQDLPTIYEENSCLYLFTREMLIKRRNRVGDRPLMFVINAQEAWDIDDELDFSIVEFLIGEELTK
jgi:CMP-N-acetylneuraminic acid synthetase